MGFGSYDESEQQDQEINDDAEGVNVHENEHQGEVTFESEASADDLIDQLQDMKADSDDE